MAHYPKGALHCITHRENDSQITAGDDKVDDFSVVGGQQYLRDLHDNHDNTTKHFIVCQYMYIPCSYSKYTSFCPKQKETCKGTLYMYMYCGIHAPNYNILFTKDYCIFPDTRPLSFCLTNKIYSG